MNKTLGRCIHKEALPQKKSVKIILSAAEANPLNFEVNIIKKKPHNGKTQRNKVKVVVEASSKTGRPKPGQQLK